MDFNGILNGKSFTNYDEYFTAVLDAIKSNIDIDTNFEYSSASLEPKKDISSESINDNCNCKINYNDNQEDFKKNFEQLKEKYDALNEKYDALNEKYDMLRADYTKIVFPWGRLPFWYNIF